MSRIFLSLLFLSLLLLANIIGFDSYAASRAISTSTALASSAKSFIGSVSRMSVGLNFSLLTSRGRFNYMISRERYNHIADHITHPETDYSLAVIMGVKKSKTLFLDYEYPKSSPDKISEEEKMQAIQRLLMKIGTFSVRNESLVIQRDLRVRHEINFHELVSSDPSIVMHGERESLASILKQKKETPFGVILRADGTNVKLDSLERVVLVSELPHSIIVELSKILNPYLLENKSVNIDELDELERRMVLDLISNSPKIIIGGEIFISADKLLEMITIF